MQLTEGLHVAERFRLVRLLGQGGMGSVWLADHLALEIPCAVKFIDREQNSPDARRRFEREAKAAAQLRGQHVVQILDHGIWDGVPYIAMEYLEGEDLNTRLERVGRLPNAQTVRIISQVAKGLARAHAAGIVHRDLKPDNIFLSKDGDDEVVKVLDFGIAKRSQTSLSEAGTKTGSLLGTPFYMSPEQARGIKAIDHRSDLFSLAIIAYQCVTGQLPFYSEGLGDVLAQIMFEPIPVPSQRATLVPPAFDGWWHRAAERKVEARFQSAKELAEALALALGISNPIDIPALEPRLIRMSTPDLSDMGVAVVPRQIAAPGEPSFVGHPTLDRPFVQTFDPPSLAAGSRRKKAVLLGGGGFALSLAALLMAFGGRGLMKNPREAVTPSQRPDVSESAPVGALPRAAAVTSQATPPVDVPAKADPAVPRSAALTPTPGLSAHDDAAGRTTGSATSSTPATSPQPRRKSKAVKGSGSKHDYGI